MLRERVLVIVFCTAGGGRGKWVCIVDVSTRDTSRWSGVAGLRIVLYNMYCIISYRSRGGVCEQRESVSSFARLHDSRAGGELGAQVRCVRSSWFGHGRGFAPR